MSRRFTTTERDTVHELIRARRDVRHFVPGVRLDENVLARVLQAGHHAPSVGLMQPWRFLRITDPALRLAISDEVEQERQATAAALGPRGDEFLRLKVEGVRECAELLVAALAPDDGTVFGRRTLPQEMALCSLACAIQNMWLAARADNCGLGWVSMFEPRRLARLLDLPAGARPIAILCIGPAERFESRPLLEIDQWRQGRPLEQMLYSNRWPADLTREGQE